MSQPPPYGSLNPSNPDKRPLPPGWIEQYDSNYKAWFYVNTVDQPPRPSWIHPLGTPPPNSPPPSQFSPPSGPPPPNNQYGGYGGPPGGYSGSSPGSYGGPQGGYGGEPPQSGGYQQQGGWQQQPQSQGSNRGWFGGGSQTPQAAQASYQQAQPPKKSGMGIGGMLAAGGVGLLGGALLEHEFSEHNEHEREEGFAQGYEDGQDDNGQYDRQDDGQYDRQDDGQDNGDYGGGDFGY